MGFLHSGPIDVLGKSRVFLTILFMLFSTESFAITDASDTHFDAMIGAPRRAPRNTRCHLDENSVEYQYGQGVLGEAREVDRAVCEFARLMGPPGNIFGMLHGIVSRWQRNNITSIMSPIVAEETCLRLMRQNAIIEISRSACALTGEPINRNQLNSSCQQYNWLVSDNECSLQQRRKFNVSDDNVVDRNRAAAREIIALQKEFFAIQYKLGHEGDLDDWNAPEGFGFTDEEASSIREEALELRHVQTYYMDDNSTLPGNYAVLLDRKEELGRQLFQYSKNWPMLFSDTDPT